MSRQPGGFKLEDVDPQFRSQISQIVTECRVTPEAAYECLLLHNLSVQDSICALKQTAGDNYSPSFHNQSRVVDRAFIDYGELDDSDEQYEPYFYYQLQEGKKYFYQKYPVNMAFMQRRHRGNRLCASADRIQIKSNDVLQSKLREIAKDSSCIPSNEVSSLEQALCISYTQKLPILFLNTDLSPESVINLKDLFSSAAFKKIVQSQFIYFGIFSCQYKLEKWLEPHIDLLSTINSILILRVNLYDDIQVIAMVRLCEGGEKVREHLKKAKSETVKKALDEKYIKYKHKMVRQGENWRRPASFIARKKKKEEQKRILSNHRIRKEQEQTYQELAVHANQQINQRNQKQQQEQSSRAQYQRNLSLKRQNLAEYYEGIRFKIRVPSGTNIYVFVPPTEKVQYLYDIIECKQEDLGFENDCPRKFDLCVGLGISAGLKDRRDERIGDVFEGGEFLIVRQVE